MNSEVELILVSDSAGVTTYSVYLNVPTNVDTASSKMYTSEAAAPVWDCETTQLLLDTIQEQGGLTVTCYGTNDQYLGTAFLTAQSEAGQICGNPQAEATLRYDAGQTTNQVAKTAYVSWQVQSGFEYHLDLYPNESISQNWKFTDIATLTATGSFTREFRIPASDKNVEALGPLYDVNFGDDNNYYNRKIAAEIRINSATIVRGYLRVMKSFLRLAGHPDYLVTFYGESPNLIRGIGEKRIKDIAALNDIDAFFNYADVSANIGDYGFFLTDRGQVWNNLGLTGRPLTVSATPVYPADLTPAIRWSWLFDKIITEAGFQYDAVELFAILQGYYMPWLNSFKPKKPSGNIVSYNFSASLNSQFTIAGAGSFLTPTTEVYDTSNSYTAGATSTYTIPLTSSYIFNVFYKYQFLDDNDLCGVYSIKVILYNVTSGGEYLLQQIYLSAGGGAYTGTSSVTSPPLGYTLGTQIKLKFVYTYAQGNCNSTIEGPSTIKILTPTSWGVAGVQQENFGFPWYPVLDAPDMKQVDLISDILKMHNVAIIPDGSVPNRIKFVPMQTYLNSGAQLDWSDKLDIDKDIEILPTTDYQKGTIKFTYSAGQEYNSLGFVNAGRIYGDYKITGYTTTPTASPSDFAIGDQEIKLVTQSTPCKAIAGTNAQVPMFLNSDLQYVVTGPRCLYASGVQAVALYNEVTDTVVSTDIPLLNHYSSNIPAIDDYDLNFAPEAPLQTMGINPYNNLFNLYYRDYLNGIYDPTARVLIGSFALDITDILEFDFSNTYWIHNSFWRVLEISDYKIGGKESTRVTLLKLPDSPPDCSVKPLTTNADGSINWVDRDGVPQDGNENCCNRYGYSWNGALELCFGNVYIDGTSGGITENLDRLIRSVVAPIEYPDTSVVAGTALNVKSDNEFGVYVGNSLDVKSGSPNALIVGDTMDVDADKHSVVALGRNTLVKNHGVHIGAGWNHNELDMPRGSQQYGSVMLGNLTTFSALAPSIKLYVSGETDLVILPLNSAWFINAYLQVQAKQGYAYHLYTLMIFKDKSGGITATTPQLLSSDSSIPNITIDMTVDTSTAEHKFYAEASGTGYPVEEAYVNLLLNYTQIVIK